jgi:hypothetical protein
MVIQPVRLSGEWLELYAAFIQSMIHNSVQAFISDLETETHVIEIMRKRVDAYALDFDISGIVMCFILGKGNPGRSLVAVLESAAVAQLSGVATVSHEFVDLIAYPGGFYSDRDAFTRFDVLRTLSHFL